MKASSVKTQITEIVDLVSEISSSVLALERKQADTSPCITQSKSLKNEPMLIGQCMDIKEASQDTNKTPDIKGFVPETENAFQTLKSELFTDSHRLSGMHIRAGAFSKSLIGKNDNIVNEKENDKDKMRRKQYKCNRACVGAYDIFKSFKASSKSKRICGGSWAPPLSKKARMNTKKYIILDGKRVTQTQLNTLKAMPLELEGAYKQIFRSTPGFRMIMPTQKKEIKIATKSKLLTVDTSIACKEDKINTLLAKKKVDKINTLIAKKKNRVKKKKKVFRLSEKSKKSKNIPLALIEKILLEKKLTNLQQQHRSTDKDILEIGTMYVSVAKMLFDNVASLSNILQIISKDALEKTNKGKTRKSKHKTKIRKKYINSTKFPKNKGFSMTECNLGAGPLVFDKYSSRSVGGIFETIYRGAPKISKENMEIHDDRNSTKIQNNTKNQMESYTYLDVESSRSAIEPRIIGGAWPPPRSNNTVDESEALVKHYSDQKDLPSGHLQTKRRLEHTKATKTITENSPISASSPSSIVSQSDDSSPSSQSYFSSIESSTNMTSTTSTNSSTTLSSVAKASFQQTNSIKKPIKKQHCFIVNPNCMHHTKHFTPVDLYSGIQAHTYSVQIPKPRVFSKRQKKQLNILNAEQAKVGPGYYKNAFISDFGKYKNPNTKSTKMRNVHDVLKYTGTTRVSRYICSLKRLRERKLRARRGPGEYNVSTKPFAHILGGYIPKASRQIGESSKVNPQSNGIGNNTMIKDDRKNVDVTYSKGVILEALCDRKCGVSVWKRCEVTKVHQNNQMYDIRFLKQNGDEDELLSEDWNSSIESSGNSLSSIESSGNSLSSSFSSGYSSSSYTSSWWSSSYCYSSEDSSANDECKYEGKTTYEGKTQKQYSMRHQKYSKRSISIGRKTIKAIRKLKGSRLRKIDSSKMNSKANEKQKSEFEVLSQFRHTQNVVGMRKPLEFNKTHSKMLSRSRRRKQKLKERGFEYNTEKSITGVQQRGSRGGPNFQKEFESRRKTKNEIEKIMRRKVTYEYGERKRDRAYDSWLKPNLHPNWSSPSGTTIRKRIEGLNAVMYKTPTVPTKQLRQKRRLEEIEAQKRSQHNLKTQRHVSWASSCGEDEANVLRMDRGLGRDNVVVRILPKTGINQRDRIVKKVINFTDVDAFIGSPTSRLRGPGYYEPTSYFNESFDANGNKSMAFNKPRVKGMVQFSKVISREDIVGPFGERATAAVEADLEFEGCLDGDAFNVINPKRVSDKSAPAFSFGKARRNIITDESEDSQVEGDMLDLDYNDRALRPRTKGFNMEKILGRSFDDSDEYNVDGYGEARDGDVLDLSVKHTLVEPRQDKGVPLLDARGARFSDSDDISYEDDFELDTARFSEIDALIRPRVQGVIDMSKIQSRWLSESDSNLEDYIGTDGDILDLDPNVGEKHTRMRNATGAVDMAKQIGRGNYHHASGNEADESTDEYSESFDERDYDLEKAFDLVKPRKDIGAIAMDKDNISRFSEDFNDLSSDGGMHEGDMLDLDPIKPSKRRVDYGIIPMGVAAPRWKDDVVDKKSAYINAVYDTKRGDVVTKRRTKETLAFDKQIGRASVLGLSSEGDSNPYNDPSFARDGDKLDLSIKHTLVEPRQDKGVPLLDARGRRFSVTESSSLQDTNAKILDVEGARAALQPSPKNILPMHLQKPRWPNATGASKFVDGDMLDLDINAIDNAKKSSVWGNVKMNNKKTEPRAPLDESKTKDKHLNESDMKAQRKRDWSEERNQREMRNLKGAKELEMKEIARKRRKQKKILMKKKADSLKKISNLQKIIEKEDKLMNTHEKLNAAVEALDGFEEFLIEKEEKRNREKEFQLQNTIAALDMFDNNFSVSEPDLESKSSRKLKKSKQKKKDLKKHQEKEHEEKLKKSKQKKKDLKKIEKRLEKEHKERDIEEKATVPYPSRAFAPYPVKYQPVPDNFVPNRADERMEKRKESKLRTKK